jgi:hypothetical protein
LNKPPKGDNFRRIGAHTEMLKVSAQDNPALTVKINAGGFFANGIDYVEYGGGSSTHVTVPTTGAKWVVILLNKAGLIDIVDGESVTNNPELPVIPQSSLPLAAIYIKAGTRIITNDMIFDIRPIFSSGVYPINHNEIGGLDADDCHPIKSIIGLNQALTIRPTEAAIQTMLETKMDLDGTPSAEFILNRDETGTPSTSVGIIVKRGDQPDVSIKFNEDADKWQFTNDGAKWYNFAEGAVTTPVEVVTYTKEESDAKYALKADIPVIPDISGKVDASIVYTKTEADAKYALKTDIIDYSSKVDATAVYTKVEADAKYALKTELPDISGKADATAVYTKTEADGLLNNKANTSDVFSKAEGVILTSSGGKKFKLVVADDGVLSTEPIV